MRRSIVAFSIAILAGSILASPALAWKKKVAQSGMTYLAVTLGARESAMGDASVAATTGVQGVFFNPAVLADLRSFGVALNQVNWLVDTRIYGAAAAYSLGRWGTIALDLVYMDYGEIMGTEVVDRSVDIRGYRLTGPLTVEDYAVGLSWAYRVSDRYAFGIRYKRVHEDLGEAAYAVREYTDPQTGSLVRERAVKDWAISAWGFDFGSYYSTGFKSLTVAMAMQNLSPDMRYWYEEFSLPLLFRIGLAADLMDFLPGSPEGVSLNVAVDGIHPTDYTERVHVGAELVFLHRYALRAGYKFNHDVETFSLGVGFGFFVAGVAARLDYAYTAANYFKDVSRLSVEFVF
ncbi:MAG: PorV/PorQ family protein [candidate division KSB1 bacterium]|nr:PorV/PorQ family protein [candidate division KSB1 bacterium]